MSHSLDVHQGHAGDMDNAVDTQVFELLHHLTHTLMHLLYKKINSMVMEVPHAHSNSESAKSAINTLTRLRRLSPTSPQIFPWSPHLQIPLVQQVQVSGWIYTEDSWSLNIINNNYFLLYNYQCDNLEHTCTCSPIGLQPATSSFKGYIAPSISTHGSLQPNPSSMLQPHGLIMVPFSEVP